MNELVTTRYGAIDIGTNAVRLVIKELRESDDGNRWYKLCYTRVPIRLGEDVFSSGTISQEKMSALGLSFKAFKHLMSALGVISYRACSTSAMREANNAADVIEYIKEATDIDLEVLSGAEEAKLIMANFRTQTLDPNTYYYFIDVGGGSTEISLIHQNEKIESKSFNIGTVRMLKGYGQDEEWDRMKSFAQYVGENYEDVVGVGTGGNINKIFKESGKKSMERMSLQDLLDVKQFLESHTYEERINNLRMRPDRADVIIPAAKIFATVLQSAKVKEIMVPKIGLSDGIILDQHLRSIQ